MNTLAITLLLVGCTVSNLLGSSQGSSGDRVFLFSSTNGIIACLTTDADTIGITYKALSKTNEFKKCAVIRADLIGKVQMTGADGTPIAASHPDVNKDTSYPNSFELNPGKVRWPRVPTFTLHTNLQGGVLRQSLFNYFKLKRRGEYVFTLHPTAYLRVPKPEGQAGWRYQRMDFPPLTNKVVITDEMIEAAKKRRR